MVLSIIIQARKKEQALLALLIPSGNSGVCSNSRKTGTIAIPTLSHISRRFVWQTRCVKQHKFYAI
jgi:hypothetical protein